MTQSSTHESFDIMRVADRTRTRARRAHAAQWMMGALLSAVGIAKRGWLGAVAGVAGAGVLVNAAFGTETAHTRKHRKSFDKVDKASLESFPASDPPGSSRVD